MTRVQMRRRLMWAWWQQLLVSLMPMVLVNKQFGHIQALYPQLAMPLFIVGVASMFISLRFFRGYKHALISTQKAFDTPQEPAAWNGLNLARCKALLAASLPVWIGALGVVVGLDSAAQLLLAFSTLVLFYLYRIPRQLG